MQYLFCCVCLVQGIIFKMQYCVPCCLRDCTYILLVLQLHVAVQARRCSGLSVLNSSWYSGSLNFVHLLTVRRKQSGNFLIMIRPQKSFRLSVQNGTHLFNKWDLFPSPDRKVRGSYSLRSIRKKWPEFRCVLHMAWRALQQWICICDKWICRRVVES
jgi:hypothetical protein